MRPRLPLIPQAVAAGVPVLGICRGFQEMNVAFGGSLWQKLHEVPGHLDHREDADQPLEEQYGPAHEVILEPGGLLRRLAGTDRIRVNSLHSQGVRELGPGLTVEAQRARWRHRGVSCRRGAAALRWRCSGTPSGSVDEQSIFARAVRRVRRGLPSRRSYR